MKRNTMCLRFVQNYGKKHKTNPLYLDKTQNRQTVPETQCALDFGHTSPNKHHHFQMQLQPQP